MCERCLLYTADHAHMFFSCPKRVGFWSGFFDTMSKALKVTLKPCSLTAIFGLPDESTNLTGRDCGVLAFASLIARRRILLLWKDPKPPSASAWFEDLLSFISLEKVKYTLRGSTDRFFDCWKPMLSYIDSLSSLDCD